MSISTNNNVSMIVNSLEMLPNVTQVRSHNPIKGTLIEKFGENSMVFACFFPQPNLLGMSAFNNFYTLATEEIYNNTNYNMVITDSMFDRMNVYYETVSSNTEIIHSGMAIYLDEGKVLAIPIYQ